MIIKVASFNIQNKYKISKYDGRDNGGDNVQKLKEFIDQYDIDILGLQELVYNYEVRLSRYLKESNFNIAGNYRLPKWSNFIPYIKRFNEANSIITKYPIKNSKTIRLPSFPNVQRIATIVQIEINKKEIYIINTHLDFLSSRIQNKQLQRLNTIIKSISGPIILMGDFNMSIHEKYFQHFIKNMAKNHLDHINILAKTHKRSKHAIDHIFLSKELGEILDVNVINIDTMSDHNPIVITINLNKKDC